MVVTSEALLTMQEFLSGLGQYAVGVLDDRSEMTMLVLRSGTAYQMMSPLLHPVNIPAPSEDILIPLLLQHCLILLYLL